VSAAPAGPLFVSPPVQPAVDWLRLLPILVALPAAAILAWGVARGRLPPALAVAGLVLPIVAYGLGMLLVMEESKGTQFCGSCHVMVPVVQHLVVSDNPSLAAIHYQRGLVPTGEACYTCHSGYGIWGTFDAKKAGVMHMVRALTGRYALPLKILGTFDIASCLGCHAGAASFRAVEAHQAPDLQAALLNRSMSCTGACHPAAHPDEALNGGGAAS
jgi:cytochrome c nitrite reductase small subunit